MGQGGNFPYCLLYVVFAKCALPMSMRGGYGIGAEGLADRNQTDLRDVAAASFGGADHAFSHGLQVDAD